MSQFKYGMIVEGEHYCPRPELSRQFVKLVESGQNVIVQGERRMGKTSFVCESVRRCRGIQLVFAREQRNFGDSMSRLTPIQASVLRGLADPSHPKLFFGEFMWANGVKNVGSVTRAINRLKEEELVYEFEGDWKFTNPFFCEWLNVQV